MTGGAGFSKDSMSRSRQNRGLLQNIKQGHFKKSKNIHKDLAKIESEPIDEKEIEVVRNRIIKQNRNDLIKRWSIFGILIIILLILFFSLTD